MPKRKKQSVRPFEVKRHYKRKIAMTHQMGFNLSEDNGYTLTVGVVNDNDCDCDCCPPDFRGWYEIISDNEDIHGEGILGFSGIELTDYDGMFSLDNNILDILEEFGFDVKQMRKDLA